MWLVWAESGIFKRGDYTIPAGATLNDIAWQIAGGNGASTDIVVFIPEGSNIWEIDERLADAEAYHRRRVRVRLWFAERATYSRYLSISTKQFIGRN